MTVLNLTAKEAKKYFMQKDNYCNFCLPQYIDFQSVLNFAEASVGRKNLDACFEDKNNKPTNLEGVNYKLLVNKDGKYAYRPLEFANPYLYYILVREITKEENWALIKKRFHEFEDKHIEVSGVPPVKEEKHKTQIKTSILNWWEKLEQRTIELSLTYRYMFVTDITNCYGSIYTHTIDWAINGKKLAKQSKNKQAGIGKMIDSCIRAMQYGQTNGIPQGSVLFDFVAELVLGYTDSLLVTRLRESNIEDYHMLRYRDDYRIFANSRENLEKISLELQSVLSEMNFLMNVSKTRMSDNIVEDAIKPDKYFYLANYPGYRNSRSFLKSLYFMVSFSKEFPNSGTICRLMTNLSRRIEKREEIKENYAVLIALLVEIAMTSPRVYQQALAAISNLIERVCDEEEKEQMVNAVYNKLHRLPNIGHIQIWMQRMTYKLDKRDNKSRYNEPLCKLIEGEQVPLWNLDWVKRELKEGFPYESICNRVELDNMTSFIDTDEVDVFAYDGF